MPGPARRTARACERCRQTRRRCEPPYPCRSCTAAGVACDVRTKARPQRRQQHHRHIAQILPEVGGSAARVYRNHDDALQDTAQAPGARSLQGDTFQLLKTLVQDMLLKRHGYALECELVEPASCRPDSIGSPRSLLAPFDALAPPRPLTSAQTWNLLTAFRDFMGWHDANLVDVDQLHIIARAHSEHLTSSSPSEVSLLATTHRLPVDSLALVYGALALGAVAVGDYEHCRFYFSIATETIKHFVGPPTLYLCIAYYLQHIFALRAGTSNYAQGIIAQAIQVAHHLGLQHNTYGVQGLQLYLLIYMADQYCSLTHNTEPMIRTSKLPANIFAPLSDTEPQLQTLVDLVTINGCIIEQCHQRSSLSLNEILDLEARIGDLCSRQFVPVPRRSSSETLRTAYEPLARIHMWCCRLRLRISGLSKQTSWLASLCICVHAAQGVLATYLQLYGPVLLALAKQGTAQDGGRSVDKCSSPTTYRVAVTWRQVKRIMMSAFVVVFAYWHGEMIHDEAARYIAMARLLLEYPRWRWGDKLDEAVRTLLDLAELADFSICEHMQTLLPGVSEQFLRPLCGPLYIGSAMSPAIDGSGTGHVGLRDDDALSASASWLPSVFGSLSPNDLSEVHLPLFGLWESVEFPIEGGS